MKKKKEETKVVVSKQKVASKGMRVLCFLLSQILFSAGLILSFMTMRNSTMDVVIGNNEFFFHRDIFEDSENCPFEDSFIFKSIFSAALQETTYLSVIKDQLETKGEFDGKKIIDINEFSQRKNLSKENDITAKFYLEDLLKWAKYGVEYTDFYVNIYNFEPDARTVLDIPEYAKVKDENGNYIPENWMLQPINYIGSGEENLCDVTCAEDGYYYGYTTILKNRYKTIDGKNLDQIVNNWEDYYRLVSKLQNTIYDLNINYEKYNATKPAYQVENSNVRFCVSTKDADGKANYQTNILNVSKATTPSSIDKFFTQYCSKYLIYSPSDMRFETNTDLTENELRSILNEYELEYELDEECKIWVGVDRSYAAQDPFSYAKSLYEADNIPPIYSIIGAIICFCLFALLMLYLIVKTGWITKDGERVLELSAFDTIPTEIFLAFVILIGLIAYAGIGLCLYDSDRISEILQSKYSVHVQAIVAAASFAFACLLGSQILSFVRRCKAKTFWKNTLLVALAKRVAKSYSTNVGNYPGSLGIVLGYVAYLLVNFFGVFCVFAAMSTQNEFIAAIILVLLLIMNWAIGMYHISCRRERFEIVEGIERIRNGEINFKLNAESMRGVNTLLADSTNHIGEGIRIAVEKSMKDEKMKADLITNVSHDIKTPLTSIINYVDLLKRENIQDEKVRGYIEVLDEKSQRLKQLTIDLVDASKISSGNVTYDLKRIHLAELVNQAIGEFSEKFEEKGLTMVSELNTEYAYVKADPRHMWRVMENLLNNIYKYAMPNTRIYLSLFSEVLENGILTSLSIKNISAQPLNIKAEELTERFIRGDVSRSTEGSGLGLSIAKSLTEGMNGKFDIYLDGDLFKVTITFRFAEEE